MDSTLSPTQLYCMPLSMINSDYLLTECKICIGNYLPEVFVFDRATKEQSLFGKIEDKYFHVQFEQTRLFRNHHFDADCE